LPTEHGACALKGAPNIAHRSEHLPGAELRRQLSADQLEMLSPFRQRRPLEFDESLRQGSIWRS
jgi:hypothetical protein